MMEAVQLAFAFTVLLSIVSGVVWAIRLEAKANRSKDEIKTLKEDFHAHQADRSIHHNEDAFAEFEKRIDLRFEHLSEGVKKVEVYVEDIDKKIAKYLNNR